MHQTPWTWLTSRRLLACLLMSFPFLLLHAQDPCSFSLDVDWQMNYGGTNSEIAKNSRPTNDGGFVVFGHTLSDDIDVANNFGGVDYWLVKTDQFGNVQWENNYGGSSTDLGASIVQTSDNGFLMIGGSLSNDQDISSPKGSYDMWMIKVDANGNKLWDKSYGGTRNDRASWLEKTSDGGYVICGTTSSSDGDVNENKGVTDALIVKLDVNANVQWTKTVGGSSEDFANHIQQTSDGGFIVTGGTFSTDGDITNNQGDLDVMIFKLDASGNLSWINTIGGSGLEWGNCIKEASDGTFVSTGATDSNNGDFSQNQGSRDLWFAKLDNGGNLIWNQSYGSSKDEIGNAIIETPSNGFLVAGHAEFTDGDVSANNGILDVWLINTTLEGDLVQDYNYGGSLSEMSEDLRFTQDGGLILTGFSESKDIDLNSNEGQADFWLLKFKPIGSGLLQPDLGEDEFLCVPQNIFFNVEISDCSDCSYLWTDGSTEANRLVYFEESTNLGLTISNANGCSVSDDINVILSDLEIVIDFSNPSGCLANGSIMATATGGSGQYTYSWSNQVMGQVNQGLNSGSYNLTLSDGVCDLRETVLLGNENANFPQFDLGEDRFLCNEETLDLIIDLENVDVLWSDGSSSGVLTVSEPGLYAVTVTNSDGCSSVDELNVNQDVINFSFGEDISTCAEEYTFDTFLKFYEHLWSTGERSPSITVFETGLYELTITSPSGCTLEEDVFIDFSENLSLELGLDVETCDSSYTIVSSLSADQYLWSTGETTDFITVTESGTYGLTISETEACTSEDEIVIEFIDGISLELGEDQESCDPLLLNPGISQVDYKWSNGSNGVALLAQETGMYALTITNNLGCSAIDSVYVEINDYPSFALPDTLSSCQSIKFDFSDSDYDFLWSNGESGSQVEIEEVGDYMITVSNSGGCTLVENIYVNITNELAFDFGEDIVSCEAFELSTSLLGLDYEWSTGAETESILITETGNYALTVSDGSGCSAIDEINVEINALPPLDLGEDLVSCSSVLLETEDEGFNYLWSDGTSSSSLLVESNGSYELTITNDQGCSIADTINVTIAEELNLELGEDLTSCEGINLSAGSFSNDIMYLWSDGTTEEEIFIESSGLYYLTITDGIACSAADSINITIEEPILFELGEDIEACGSIEIHAPTKGASYLWSTGDVGTSTLVVETGVVSLIISTEGSCESKDSVLVTISEGFELEVFKQDLDCAGDQNGFINLSVNGANGNASYLWDDAVTASDRSDLSAGIYTVTISDEADCEQIKSIEIIEPPAIEINLESIKHISCDNVIGEVNVSASGGLGELTYAWDHINGQGNRLVISEGGFYTLTVSDENNCTNEKTFEVYESENLLVFVDSIVGNPCPGLVQGYLSIDVLTGTGPYTYELLDVNSGSTSLHDGPIFSNLESGQYSVEVTDATGCSSVLDFSIESPVEIELNLDASSSCGDLGFAFTEVTGGLGPYIYTWSTGDTTKFVTELISGTYGLTVMDVEGCTHDTSFVILNFDEILYELDIQEVSCYGEKDASITIEITQGTPPYVYEWTNGAGSNPTADSLGAFNYTVFVTDDNGCTIAATTEINQPDPIDIQSDIENVQVTSDGSISLTVNGGTSPYEYLWSQGATTSSITGLPVGVYSVTITDANDCMYVEEYEITDLVALHHSFAESIHVYPNPSDGILYLEGQSDEDLQVEVLNALGQSLFLQFVPQGNLNQRLNIQVLNPGIYFLRFKNDKHFSESIKILKL